jgi:hypothetical protein
MSLCPLWEAKGLAARGQWELVLARLGNQLKRLKYNPTVEDQAHIRSAMLLLCCSNFV